MGTGMNMGTGMGMGAGAEGTRTTKRRADETEWTGRDEG